MPGVTLPTSSQDEVPDEEPTAIKRPRLSTHEVAEAILRTEHYALDAGGKLYAYQDGAYRARGRRHLNARVKRYLRSRHRADEWSSYRASEVTAYIEADAPHLWTRPPLGTLNVANGLLDIETGKLREHDPSFLCPVQLPVCYHPSANCPEWLRFGAEVLPDDCQDLLFELAAWLMLPNKNVQKAVLLLGDGANGKSTALAALVAFLGVKNAAGLSLHRLERDRFAVAHLVGKLANICADLPSTHLDSTSVFKSLTGDDPVLTAERKHMEQFEFDCFTRLVFSANHPPRSSDATEGFFRRWLVVPFDRSFDEKEALPREQIDARLHDPGELSGVLNRALVAIPRIHLSTTLTESASMEAARTEFRRTTDPLGVWLDQHTVVAPDAMVSRSALIDAYNASAAQARQPAMTQTRFGRALKRMHPEIKDAQRVLDGKRQWVYVGIGVKSAREGDRE